MIKKYLIFKHLSSPGWKQTPAGRQQTLGVRLPSASAGASGSFWRASVSQQRSSPQTQSRQFTPPTLGARSPVGRILPNRTCLRHLRFSIFPVKPLDFFFFFFLFHFHSVSQLETAVLQPGLATKQLFMIVISIRASYSHYLHYHPPLFACSLSTPSVLPSRCAPDFPEGCQDCHGLRLSPFINKPSCCRVSSSP